jgi:hypothetical protein
LFALQDLPWARLRHDGRDTAGECLGDAHAEVFGIGTQHQRCRPGKQRIALTIVDLAEPERA